MSDSEFDDLPEGPLRDDEIKLLRKVARKWMMDESRKAGRRRLWPYIFAGPGLIAGIGAGIAALVDWWIRWFPHK